MSDFDGVQLPKGQFRIQLAVRPIEDEWIMGLVARLHRLSGPIGFTRFYSTRFNLPVPYTTAHTVRTVVASGAWGPPDLVAEERTFRNYFAQFMGGNGTGRFPESEADMLFSGRCKNESDTPQMPLGLRACPACGKEQDRDHGFRTYLRSHNLPGVKACWRHGLELVRNTAGPYELSVPSAVDQQEWTYASHADVWFARVSRNALLSPGTGTHYQHELRHAASVACGDKLASSLTQELLAAYPGPFLEAQKLDAKTLERRLRLHTRGYQHRSIGCSRILLLLSSLRRGSGPKLDASLVGQGGLAPIGRLKPRPVNPP